MDQRIASMTVTLNTASRINVESTDKNYPRRNGKLGIGQDETVKLQI
jgi:hypothetical protein